MGVQKFGSMASMLVDANTFEHAYPYSENGNASVFEIGGSEYSDNGGHPNNYSGLLADIRVYNELLTPDEISERFNGNELVNRVLRYSRLNKILMTIL